MKVVRPYNLPTRAPVLDTVVAWLLLDRLHAPQWIWTTVAVCWVAEWLLWFALLFVEERTDIFEGD